MSLVWILKGKKEVEVPGRQESDTTELEERLVKLEEKSGFFIQKFGFLRFNPYGEIGGDQSFSAALLNGHDDGFVITSLHNRSGTRTYGKAIKTGKSSQGLSKEEEKVILKAKENEKVE